MGTHDEVELANDAVDPVVGDHDAVECVFCFLNLDATVHLHFIGELSFRAKKNVKIIFLF